MNLTMIPSEIVGEEKHRADGQPHPCFEPASGLKGFEKGYAKEQDKDGEVRTNFDFFHESAFLSFRTTVFEERKAHASTRPRTQGRITDDPANMEGILADFCLQPRRIAQS